MRPPLHIYPIDDIAYHVLDQAERASVTGKGACPCGPAYRRERGTLVVVHKAFDGREVAEWIDQNSKFQNEQ